MNKIQHKFCNKYFFIFDSMSIFEKCANKIPYNKALPIMWKRLHNYLVAKAIKYKYFVTQTVGVTKREILKIFA